MKRLLPLLLVLLMLLAACGSEKAATVESTDPTPTTATEPTPTEPPEPVYLYNNPLNGTPLEEEWEGRPTAVVINNITDALPHYGTSEADFLFEAETESGITRMLAIYDNVSEIGQIGPIRSDRTFFNSIAKSFDAAIVHCGGSVRGRNGYHDLSGSKISDWAHLDATYYEGSYFFRDNDRYKYQGYNWEHCLFSNGELIQKGLVAREISEPTAFSTDFGLTFTEDASLSGAAANVVTISFRGGKTTTFTYDADYNIYFTSQYGSDYIDVSNDQHVSFRNVIILVTDQTIRSDGEYPRSYYTLIGEGDGYLAIDGKIVNIKWSRESLEAPFAYTLADGTAVTLGTGHTYVGITSADCTYE